MNGIDEQHIDIIRNVPPNQYQPGSLNLPSQDLLNGTNEFYKQIRLPLLYKALLMGDLKATQSIIRKCSDLVRFSINEKDETVLHIAVLGNSITLVNYLIENMNEEDFKLQNRKGETCLHIAAITGNVEIANKLMSKNESLPDIPDSDGKTPLYRAALNRKHKMVQVLYDKSPDTNNGIWTAEYRGRVLVKCVEANLFDVALKMVKKFPELAANGDVLTLLARKPDAFCVTRPSIEGRLIRSTSDTENRALKLLRLILTEIRKLTNDKFDNLLRGPSGDETNEDEKQVRYEKESQEELHLLRTISENVAAMPDKIYSQFNRLGTNGNAMTSGDAKNKCYSQVIFLAAEVGNTKFVKEVIQEYPHLCLEVNENNQSIFHVAVSHGHEGIYRLLFGIGSISDAIMSLEDTKGNNILHLVGDMTKHNTVQNIRGVGLRLNPAILWFQDIEKKVPPHLQEKKNASGLTPQKAFVKNHKHLFSKGEEWMKEIAIQLMVVAALLATISFPALTTAPGGNNADTGDALFSHLIAFQIFMICDSLSFIFSTTSIFMVLSILGSNYDGYDFMLSLSNQLMICLLSVSVSIFTLIIAFLTIPFISSNHVYIWLPVSITAPTCFLILAFGFSNYNILSPVIRVFIRNFGSHDSVSKFHMD